MAVQISLIVGILLYGIVLSRFIAPRFHFVANVLTSVIAICVALALGLSFDDLGMGLHVVLKGLLIAIGVSATVIVGVFIVASLPPLKHYFVLAQHMKPTRVAYETAVRIPLSTALTEEIIFRGVLLGVMLTQYDTVASVAICSVVFGLWHILPSLDRFRMHSGITKTKRLSAGYVLATIGATAIAGVFFSWLRIMAGSIVAPWLTHWSINASAMLASAFLAHKSNKKAAR